MSASTFDTYAAVKALREAGADEAMAEAIVNTASAAAGAGHDELATKADLHTAIEPLATKVDLASVRAELGDHPMGHRPTSGFHVRHRPSGLRPTLTRRRQLRSRLVVPRREVARLCYGAGR